MQGLERVFQKFDVRYNPAPNPVLKRPTKRRPSWDAELVLEVIALCMAAAIAAVVLDGAGLI